MLINIYSLCYFFLIIWYNYAVVVLGVDPWHGLDWPGMALVSQGATDAVHQRSRQHDVPKGSKVSRDVVL